MPRLRYPSESARFGFIAEQSKLEFSYPGVGATRGEPPNGYTVDRNRVRIGQGQRDFAKAANLLRAWRMFDLGWVRAFPSDASIREGTTVAVIAHTLGLVFLNACRIVYVVDDEHRFGFAYGTLPEHAESGEERFLVELDPRDDGVSYSLLAFSRPNQLLSRVGYPLTRRLQRKFARDSMAKMVTAMQR